MNRACLLGENAFIQTSKTGTKSVNVEKSPYNNTVTNELGDGIYIRLTFELFLLEEAKYLRI